MLVYTSTRLLRPYYKGSGVYDSVPEELRSATIKYEEA